MASQRCCQLATLWRAHNAVCNRTGARAKVAGTAPARRRFLSTGGPHHSGRSSSAGGRRGRGPWKPLMAAVLVAAASAASLDLFVPQTPLWGSAQEEEEEEGGEDVQDTHYMRYLDEPMRERPRLHEAEEKEADVCVVGGGYAGLVTALELAERGLRVVVLERERVGRGASGLNGGFMVKGFQVEGLELAELVGPEKARLMFALTTAAQARLIERIQRHAIACDLGATGMVTLSYRAGQQAEAEKAAHAHNDLFGTQLEVWPEERVRKLYKSELYHHAVFDPSVHTVGNPLGLVLGLARIAEDKLGVTIYEGTAATAIERCSAEQDEQQQQHQNKNKNKKNKKKDEGADHDFDYRQRTYRVVTSSGGVVRAGAVVLAGSAQLCADLDRKVARAVAPVFTYIVVTEPLPQLREVIGPDYAVCDDRFALNYYRPLPDGRLLWGGFAQTFPISRAKLKQEMVKDLLRVYPSLELVTPQGSAQPRCIQAETAWGGTLAYGLSLMPMIGRHPDNGVWYATGFGGHGLVPTSMAGELLASAIASKGQDTRWKMFQEEFPLGYSMWPFARAAAQLMYWWFTLRDSWNSGALLSGWKNKPSQAG